MFQYQKNKNFFAQIGDGLEEAGATELHGLGAQDIQTKYRGISFLADQETLYRINYSTRLCTRILAPLITFDCHSTKYLYKTAINLPWQDLLSPKDTFAVFGSTANSKITHSQYASLIVKDAVADFFREKTGERPNVDTRDPDISINLRIEKNRAIISLDLSGGSLHRRGYRSEAVEAPMQETLAAAIIALSGWDGERPIYDPMCGSGTIPAEALMHYCRIPSGFLRPRFGFERLPDFDLQKWEQVKKQATAGIRPLPKNLIFGSDKGNKAIKAARTNLQALPQSNAITLTRTPFQDIAEINNALIICNPPYGVRLGQQEEAAALVQAFGDFLKQRCTGSTAFLYLGRRELIKAVGLKPSKKIPLKAGGLDGILAKYELY